MNYVIILTDSRSFHNATMYHTDYENYSTLDWNHQKIRVKQSGDLAKAKIFADRLEAEDEANWIMRYRMYKIDCVTDQQLHDAKKARFKKELQG